MFSTTGAILGLVVASLVAYNLLRYALATQRATSLPPGPPTIPFLGNLHQIPTTKAYLKFQEWSRRYGPIVSLKLGPGNLIILNSPRVVRDLFDKRGAIYSSRAPNHIGAELITRDKTHLLLMPYSPEWRGQRKVYQTILNITAVTSYQLLQEAEAVLTLKQLSESPDKYYDHVRRYSTAVILSSVFGIRGPEFNHPNIQRLYHVQDQFTAILETGAMPPVDIFPILKFLPTFMAPWRKWALKIRAEQRQLYFELLQNVKDRMERGVRRRCFMDELMQESQKEKHGLDDEHVAYIGGVLMEGGSDTTSSTLLSFLLAMVKYPRVFKKAQEAVDKICGTNRSPTFEDLENLPYIKSCVNEVLRWRPVAAGGIPHALIQDDTYDGYHFPKGSVFLANTWAIQHDPEYYDRPDEFIPERFEQNEYGYKTNLEIPDRMRTTYSFGAGRRICPGQHLAENSLLINVSKLVWAFYITPGNDTRTGASLSSEDVRDSVETEWTNGFLIAPKPFPITLKVRSAQHQQIIDRECIEAQEVFKGYED
ncbi:cytochrome P450 [Xylogone sp. PMI_703]|nr:cytochrome P450 [Xylogone sp. PMI_703]